MESESRLETSVIYIGAENIISPLGKSAEENFSQIKAGNTGLKKYQNTFVDTPTSILGYIDEPNLLEGMTKIESLMVHSLEKSLSMFTKKTNEGKWIFILSTTKGDIDKLKEGQIEESKPSYLVKRVMDQLSLSMDSIVVSNACISGLLAAIHAHDLIKTGQYDHAIVIGADLITEFTYRGFESFYALSLEACQPFDLNRTGLSLGEGVASAILSGEKAAFSQPPMIFKGGATANDANHISGPSRNGEGLYRAITRALGAAEMEADQIDFISAHGTATTFNDDMESIAFGRSGLENVPVNSFKGFYGHTLGASSLIELNLSIQSMRNSLLIKNIGCVTPGTAEKINVLTKNKQQEVNTVLKTASGFGGCNAAAIIKKLN